MLAPCGQRVQVALSTPGKEAAQVGFGVLPGRALEAGQMGSRRQPQLISRRQWRATTATHPRPSGAARSRTPIMRHPAPAPAEQDRTEDLDVSTNDVFEFPSLRRVLATDLDPRRADIADQPRRGPCECRRECVRSLGSFPSLAVTLPIGMTPGGPSSQPWLDRPARRPTGPAPGRGSCRALSSGSTGTPCRSWRPACSRRVRSRHARTRWTRLAGTALRREGSGQVSHGWSCPGNIGCVTWRQRGTRAVRLAGGT